MTHSSADLLQQLSMCISPVRQRPRHRWDTSRRLLAQQTLIVYTWTSLVSFCINMHIFWRERGTDRCFSRIQKIYFAKLIFRLNTDSGTEGCFYLNPQLCLQRWLDFHPILYKRLVNKCKVSPDSKLIKINLTESWSRCETLSSTASDYLWHRKQSRTKAQSHFHSILFTIYPS